VTCSVPVSFVQATLGGELEVPTLEGRGKLRIPAGTQSGSVLRIKGKGIPRRKRSGRGRTNCRRGDRRGADLADGRQREIVEQLAKELGTDVQPRRRPFFGEAEGILRVGANEHATSRARVVIPASICIPIPLARIDGRKTDMP